MTAPLDENSAERPAPGEPEPEPERETVGEPEPFESSAQTEAKPGRSGSGWVIEVVETLVLTLVIFLVIQNFIAQPFQVQGSSMETTFLDGQYVLVDRLSHVWSPYARGQVIVFHPPEGAGENGYPFIKRVIGLPGDTVALQDGKVLVNGTILDEPYAYRDENGVTEPTEPLTEVSSWTVPPGDVFVMGDHRQASEDGRAFGPIPISSVIGRVLIRYWPLSAFGPIPAATDAP